MEEEEAWAWRVQLPLPGPWNWQAASLTQRHKAGQCVQYKRATLIYRSDLTPRLHVEDGLQTTREFNWEIPLHLHCCHPLVFYLPSAGSMPGDEQLLMSFIFLLKSKFNS